MAGETPRRVVRVGTLWADCEEIAALHGVTMSDFVRIALETFIEVPDHGERLEAGRTRARAG